MEQVALSKAVITPQYRCQIGWQTLQGFPKSLGEREQVSFTTIWSSQTGFAMTGSKVAEIARMTGLNHLLKSSVMASHLMLLAYGLMYLNHRVFNFQATEKAPEKVPSLYSSDTKAQKVLFFSKKFFMNNSNCCL